MVWVYTLWEKKHRPPNWIYCNFLSSQNIIKGFWMPLLPSILTDCGSFVEIDGTITNYDHFKV